MLWIRMSIGIRMDVLTAVLKSVTTLVVAMLTLTTAGAESVSACIDSETENNNRKSRADGPLCSGLLLEGSIGGRRDEDWFTFELSEPGQLDIVLDHASGDDFDWDLYRSSGGAVASGATSQVPEIGTYTTDQPGPYWLKISRYSGTGWYDLTMTFTAQDGGGGGGGGSACDHGPRPTKPGSLSVWLTGSADDACVTPGGPGVLAMGGGSDVNAAFQRLAPLIAGGDVVILRTSGSDGYNDYLDGLMSPNSVETLLVDSRTKANSDYVDWVVRSAEMVFLAGGDQSDYLNQWQGTLLNEALKSVYEKGGIVGGTSAGNAVLSEVIYDPDGVLGIYSSEAVTDPCHEYMNLSVGFLAPQWMAHMVNDTHFAERDRMGRLLTFMARTAQPTLSPTVQPITGLGVDEATSIYISDSGLGVVDGSGSVYVLRETAQTSRIQVSCGDPVRYEGVDRYRLRDGDTFDFSTGISTVAPIAIGIDGRSGSFYIPSDPYP